MFLAENGLFFVGVDRCIRPQFVWICNPDAIIIRIYNPIKQNRIKRIANPDILFAVGLQIRQNGERGGRQIQQNGEAFRIMNSFSRYDLVRLDLQSRHNYYKDL